MVSRDSFAALLQQRLCDLGAILVPRIIMNSKTGVLRLLGQDVLHLRPINQAKFGRLSDGTKKHGVKNMQECLLGATGDPPLRGGFFQS